MFRRALIARKMLNSLWPLAVVPIIVNRNNRGVVMQYTHMLVRPNSPTSIASSSKESSVFESSRGIPCVIGVYGVKDGKQHAAIRSFGDTNDLSEVYLFVTQCKYDTATIIVFHPSEPPPRGSRPFTDYDHVITTAAHTLPNAHIKYETDTRACGGVKWVNSDKIAHSFDHGCIYYDDDDLGKTKVPVYFEIMLGTTPDTSYYRSIASNYVHHTFTQ